MPIIVFIALALAVSQYINTPLADPDLWWHIVSGRWIVANHSFPIEDLWTQFGSGKHWQAYSWSNEIVYAFTDRFFGLSGLFNLQALLAFAFVLTTFYLFNKTSKSPVLGCLLGCIVVVGCQQHFSLRPQCFVWLLFAALLLNCITVEKNGLKTINLSYFFIIFCAWANTHISTLLGLVSCVLWLMPFPLKNSGKSIKTVSKVLLVSFAATFATPYLGKEWLTFFSKTGHPFQFSTIDEFAPATILDVSGCILLLMLVLALAFWSIKKDSINIFQFILTAILCFGSLLVMKFAPFALIALGCIICKQWRSGLPSEEPGLIEALKKLESLIKWLPHSGLAFLLLSVAFINYSKTQQLLIDRDSLPISAANLMQDLNLKGPLMNSFGDGGYLMYSFSTPGGEAIHKVSIDGRTNLIDSKLWHEYEAARSGSWGWEKYMQRINPEVIIWRLDSPLIRLLEAKGEWCTVLSGNKLNNSALLLKKTTVESLRVSGKNISCIISSSSK